MIEWYQTYSAFCEEAFCRGMFLAVRKGENGMVLYFLIALAALLLFFGFLMSQRLLYIRIKSMDKILEYETQNNHFDKAWFDGLEKERVLVQSPYGYTLSGWFVPGENPAGKTMIFCHGVTVNHICEVKYARIFHKKGWNLFLYDHRRHGESEGPSTTFGFHEKYDLKAVVEYVAGRLEPGAVIGLHGESMGAAVILQYGAMEDRVDFFIADCAYSGLWQQLSHLLKKDYHLPVFPFLYITDLFVRIRGKVRMKDICPLTAVKSIQKPVLFIHGDADTYVPAFMSEEMFNAKQGTKGLYLARDAAHAQSYKADPIQYEAVVCDFLKQAGLDG
jgi:fermentation-respiration switch protein FrsA (DUF1100 family)